MKPLHISDGRLAFLFGVVFISLIIALAVYNPNPSAFEYTVFRIVIALAAAGVGAVLPGFLDVKFRGWLRAGGALALFVIVYFFAPAAMSAGLDPRPAEVEGNPRAEAERWLSVVDQGQYASAYARMSPNFTSRFGREDMETLIQGERSALGSVVSRRFVIAQPYVNPPGAPPGAYRVIGFQTRFSRHREPIHESIQLFSDRVGWRVTGFSTWERTSSGQLVPFVPD
jgi:hypothetical protein